MRSLPVAARHPRQGDRADAARQRVV